MGRVLIALLASLAFARPAAAEVAIEDVGWQLAIQVPNQKKKYHDVREWHFPPSQAMKLRARAVVSLVNKARKTDSAIVLRYVFTARLRRIGTEKEGTWTVPFLVEERRIPRFGGGQKKRVPLQINRVALRSYLKRVHHSGFWPDALRVRVVVEPRPGETFENRVRESTLPVLWRAPHLSRKDK